MTTDYQQFLHQRLPGQVAKVARHTLPDGTSAWLKKAGPRIAPWRYSLLRAAAQLLRVPLLQPVVNPGGCEAIATEVRRLRDLAARGLRVPQVLAVQADGFLMRDLGARSLANEMRHAGSPERLLWLWQRGLAALQQVHERGTCLSQGFARNMVRCTDDVIGFIDFEDDPPATLPRPLCIIKDALCYAHSTALLLEQSALMDTARADWQCWRSGLDAATCAALDDTVRHMRWAARLPRSPRLGRDAQRLGAMAALVM